MVRARFADLMVILHVPVHLVFSLFPPSVIVLLQSPPTTIESIQSPVVDPILVDPHR